MYPILSLFGFSFGTYGICCVIGGALARPVRHAGGLCLGTHWRISGSKTALSSGFIL